MKKKAGPDLNFTFERLLVGSEDLNISLCVDKSQLYLHLERSPLLSFNMIGGPSQAAGKHIPERSGVSNAIIWNKLTFRDNGETWLYQKLPELDEDRL